jgi:hypothetical protein
MVAGTVQVFRIDDKSPRLHTDAVELRKQQRASLDVAP